MPTFVVNSAILRPVQDPKACATGAPKMLTKAGIQNIKLKSCYCCAEHGSVIFVVEGENRGSVLDAFNRINVPVASILEAEEVKQAVQTSVTA